MDLTVLTDEIDYWDNIFQSSTSEDVFYELSFFKIFVKFEQFMIAAFIHYATGGNSNTNYQPQRKLEFSSLPHLEGVFIIESKKYLIEKPESIEQLAKHIFKDDDNPFETIFNDSRFNDNIGYMRTIRNHIAHGSDESLKKYNRQICNNSNYIEPHQYLLTKRRGNALTNYSLFIEILKVHTQIIYNYIK